MSTTAVLLDRVRLAAAIHERCLNEVAAAAARRDRLIREAAARGVPASEIAEAAGMTRQRVWQITSADADQKDSDG